MRYRASATGCWGGWRPSQISHLRVVAAELAERGNRLIAAGLANLIAFGRPYIANPDLVERIANGAPLAEVDWVTVYASGPRGYSDYPSIRHAMT
jgi:2,4-dienoyl-CoA reductase-like NADH-dependent reductase (Old Yellow Enzyme family)